MLRVAFKQFAWRKCWFTPCQTDWAGFMPNEYYFTCYGSLIRLRGPLKSSPMGMPWLDLQDHRATLHAAKVTTYKKRTVAYWFRDTPRTRAIFTNAGIEFTIKELTNVT